MYVCQCAAATDHQIADLVAAGCTDLGAIAQALGVTADCGGCLPAVTELLEQLVGDPARVVSAGAA